MRTVVLFPILLIVRSKFSGVYEYTPTSREYDTVFTSDGGKYFTATNDGEIKSYIVNETGFYNIITQMISLPRPMFSITPTGSHVIATKNTIVYIYSVASNSFTLLFTHDWGVTIRVTALSDDGVYGYCGDVDGTLLVIHIPTTSITQSIVSSTPGKTLWSIRPSDDGSILLIGGDEKDLRRFQLSGSTYSLDTNVNLNSQIVKIESVLNFLFVLVLCRDGNI